MKTMKKSISLLLVLTLLLSFSFVFTLGASAATAKYNCDRTVTFTVRTGNAKTTPSIKLVCNGASSQGHRCNAPLMGITVSPSVNGQSFFLIKGCGKSITSTLKLAKGRTYTVRVSYYVNNKNACSARWGDLGHAAVHDMGVGGLASRYRGFGGFDCYRNGSWYIASTKNATVSGIRVR